MRCCFRAYLIRKYKSYITAALITITIIYISHFKGYSYVHMSKRSIHSALYRKVNTSVLKKDIPNCPYMNVLFNKQTVKPMDVLKNYSNFNADGIDNGEYSPKKCNPLFSVAIVVTYRQRREYLDIFLPYMHNFLRRQNIHYKIYVVEQIDSWPFNRGLLSNVGARAAAARFPCLVLHDVDLLPLDAANLYACTTGPRHLSATIDKYEFTLLYDTDVGGVLAIRTDQYIKLNGYSNRFWGWGAEDDDFYMRLYAQRIKLIRSPPSMSRYTMLEHARPLVSASLRELRSVRAHDGLRSAPARARVRSLDMRLYTLLTVYTYGPNFTYVSYDTQLNHSNRFSHRDINILEV